MSLGIPANGPGGPGIAKSAGKGHGGAAASVDPDGRQRFSDVLHGVAGGKARSKDGTTPARHAAPEREAHPAQAPSERENRDGDKVAAGIEGVIAPVPAAAERAWHRPRLAGSEGHQHRDMAGEAQRPSLARHGMKDAAPAAAIGSPAAEPAISAGPLPEGERPPAAGAGAAPLRAARAPAPGNAHSAAPQTQAVPITVLARETHPAPALDRHATARIPPAPAAESREADSPQHGGPDAGARSARLPRPAEPAGKPGNEPPSRAQAQRLPETVVTADPQAARPARQIADAIAAEIGGKPSPASAATSPVPTAPSMPADAAPAKVLRIALQPEALGRVTVQLLARGDSLHVAIAADHAETAVLLERDRHALARLLDASGLKVDEASIRISAADPTPARTPADPAVMQPAPQFASGPAAGGGAEGGRGGAAQPKDRDAAPHREEEENALDSDPRRPLGALYV